MIINPNTKDTNKITSISSLMNEIAELRGKHLYAAVEIDKEAQSLPAVKKHVANELSDAAYQTGEQLNELEQQCWFFQQRAKQLAEQINEYIEKGSYELQADIALSFQLKALAAFIE